MKSRMRQLSLPWLQSNLQPFIWIAALIALYSLDLDQWTSLCFFKFLGIETCPGCGLGHAVHYALHFRFMASFQEHIFGIPAVVLIFGQIFKTCKFKYYSDGCTISNDAERRHA